MDGQNEVTVATFDYDALGRRIRKVDSVASETTLYYYNPDWQCLEERNGSDVLQRSFVYGNYVDEALLMDDGNNDYYYLHDHLYSVVALLSSGGAVVERYEYDAYGKMTRFDPDFTAWSGTEAGNPYYFTGRRLDELDSDSLEVMYYRYRYFDSYAGRFLQHDQVGYVDGVNLYEFVRGNPLGLLDPEGRSPITVGGGIALLAVTRCFLPYYIVAQRKYADETDHFRHCWVSCMVSRDCGQILSRLGGLTKEARDILGKQINDYIFEHYPDLFNDDDGEVTNRDWGSVILDSIDDLIANKTGYRCAGGETWIPGIGMITRWFRDSCECCCDKTIGEN